MRAAYIMAQDPTKGTETVAAEVGMNGRTLRRRAKEPAFMAFLAQMREDRGRLVASSAAKEEARRLPITFTFFDAAAAYLEIRNDPNAKHSDKLRAIDSLVELFSLKEPGTPRLPQPAPTPTVAAPAAEPVHANPDLPKPNVYRASWMKQ